MLDARGARRSPARCCRSIPTCGTRERTRFTILFDPGRVKRGILPNRAMGRPLTRRAARSPRRLAASGPTRRGGRSRRSSARPIASARRSSAARAAAWQHRSARRPARAIRSSSRFPRRSIAACCSALSRRARQRTLPARCASTRRNAVDVRARARRGSAGDYAIVVLPALEDPAGNRIGRAFEARDPGDDTRQAPARMPFTIR